VNPEQYLPLVRKPSRYIGNEFNVVVKDPELVQCQILLTFPDLYEIGMSHLGLQILYHILNDRDDVLAERLYTPDTDLEEMLRENREMLFSLETRREPKEFDVLAVTLPYELCYTNILTILDLADVPFYAKDRTEEHPLVIGGGPGAFHPEPVADFFDAILLGDGEEAVLEIADLLIRAQKEGWSRLQTLTEMTRIEGMYVPCFFEPQYDESGLFNGIIPLLDGYTEVRRRVLSGFDHQKPATPLVPVGKVIHDRLGIEIGRGCTRGCRFCQAGMIYRPVRERSPEQILEIAEKGIGSTGFEELAMLSLSTGDYSCLGPVLMRLMDIYAVKRVSVSMPSMRVGTLTEEIMTQIKRVRKTGFTVAPEAGTDRLREVINKGITEEDLLTTCQSAFGLGWKLIKFYFMFGLPTETWDDIEAIADLAHKGLKAGSGPGRKITVSAATFVPKPHTPFQWEPQLTVDEGFERIEFLREKLREKGLQLRWGDPRQSFLEGVFSRGDRKLSKLIVQAWQDGARLDSWNEHFRLTLWRQSAETVDIDLDSYMGRREFGSPLPWDHLHCGVDASFLREEYEKGLKQEYTPDCRVHGCQKCGLCDFKEVYPKTFARGCDLDFSLPVEIKQAKGHFRFRFDYSRLGRSRLLSHLELLQLFFRAFNRAGLPLHYSQGFNPSPKVSFSPALPLGTESRAEYLFVDLTENIEPQIWLERLNVQLPDGLSIQTIEFSESKKIPPRVETWYTVYFPYEIDQKMFDDFKESDSFPVTVMRKKKPRVLDAKSRIGTWNRVDNTTLEMSIVTEVSQAGLKPVEIVQAVFALEQKNVIRLRMVKERFIARKESG
jgi:radical SAM family uncharacterized protein/radical SAM-linked protein